MPSWSPSSNASRPNGGAALAELREATAADIPAMLEVFFAAIEDLDARRGRTAQARNAAPLETHFGHLLQTDPRSSYVADDHGHIVAFGIVMRRGDVAFLSFLFVLPAWQARRVGRAVLAACLEGAAGLDAVATCAEADQPVSTGLYATAGLAPRLPIYLLRGALATGALPDLRSGVERRLITPDAVAGLDRELVGYERPQDHAFWARERTGALFTDAGARVLGYGYAHPSGRVGPVAAADPGDLPSFIGSLVALTPVLEGRQLVVPGTAISALQPLLHSGMRIDGTPAIYCSVHQPPLFDRYVPMSYALL